MDEKVNHFSLKDTKCFQRCFFFKHFSRKKALFHKMTFKMFVLVLTLPVCLRRKRHKRNESKAADVPPLSTSLAGRFVCDHFIIVITIFAPNCVPHRTCTSHCCQNRTRIVKHLAAPGGCRPEADWRKRMNCVCRLCGCFCVCVYKAEGRAW